MVFHSSEAIDSGERIPIRLGPGLAFGSGEHETTRSCLEEMENIPVFSVAKVLDIGCGTGILSIAAAKLGARSVVALDPEPEAIEATINNIKLNRVEKKISILQGEVQMVRGERFNLIVANLYGDVLLTLASEIPPLLETGGYTLLSGIAFEYTYEVKTKLVKAGCELLKSMFLEEYCTLLFQKKA